ncbi:hypothetical protein ACIGHB_05035 [Streptomyces sp. NPDC085460]|uniref:hypothetical protein n=1 Tax=Streptomyces sp. NPDC085460 TaxID=3365723 RepID=UPI0037D479D2
MTTDPFAGTEQPIAEEDLLIPRPDLGPGCHTLVPRGEPIPPHLSVLRTAAENSNENKRSKRS